MSVSIDRRGFLGGLAALLGSLFLPKTAKANPNPEQIDGVTFYTGKSGSYTPNSVYQYVMLDRDAGYVHEGSLLYWTCRDGEYVVSTKPDSMRVAGIAIDKTMPSRRSGWMLISGFQSGYPPTAELMKYARPLSSM